MGTGIPLVVVAVAVGAWLQSLTCPQDPYFSAMYGGVRFAGKLLSDANLR